MQIKRTDVHPAFVSALATLPSQKVPRRQSFLEQLLGANVEYEDSGFCLLPNELREIADEGAYTDGGRKWALPGVSTELINDPVVRSYFGALAELAAATESVAVESLYLQGLNDALDAYLRFDERQRRTENAIRRIATRGTYDSKRAQLELQLRMTYDDARRQWLQLELDRLSEKSLTFFESQADELSQIKSQISTTKDEVTLQVLQNALHQLEGRATNFYALRTCLERIKARKMMIGQRLAAVRELLISGNLNTGTGVADGGGLALLRDLNEDLTKDAVFAQEAEAEEILRSITP